MNIDMQSYAGQKVHILQPMKVRVKRSWKERLFTMPFQPFKTHKTVWQETVKDGDVIWANGVAMMNNRTHMEFRKQMAARHGS